MTTIPLRLKKKLAETYSVEPNDLGLNFLTFYFKKLSVYLKTIPFVYIIPLTLIISVVLYFVLGKLLIRLVNILQYGF